MDDPFEKMVKNLQKKIEQDEEKTYSATVISEYRNPAYFGILTNPDVTAEFTGPCHDTMKFTLSIKKNTITNARFWTDGCGATVAAGNRLTKMILGKTLQQVQNIKASTLLKELNGLPDEHLHCATLAVTTLQKAIQNYTHQK